MKLTVRIIAILLVLLLLFSGCTKNNEVSEDATLSDTVATETNDWLRRYMTTSYTPYRFLEEYSDDKDLHYPTDKQKYYNIIDENKRLPIVQLNESEFSALMDIVTADQVHNITSSLNSHIVITIGDFNNNVKAISGIKTLKPKNYKYAYNLYYYNGITICVMYDNLGGVLWYKEIFIFDKTQSYDELKNNLTMTYEEGKNTKKDLYEVDQYLAEISDEAFQYVAYVDRYTTHMTEKGFLIIGYKNKKPHQVKYSFLAKGIYKKLHQSLLLDMILDDRLKG